MIDVAPQRDMTFEQDVCWQYHIRVSNYDRDVIESGLSQKDIQFLKTSDFTFVPVTDRDERRRLREFIERHEWLGNLSQYTTHWFAGYHKNVLAGVQLFNMPNSFSKMLGDNTPELERLISRGACISWTPKNLASNFLMWCIRWMVDNTQYRLFSAYSDPMAKELGTIYQACNFYYVGKGAGANVRYINPYTGKIVSDRFFRQRTAYRKYAKELGITWQKEWTTATGMNWKCIPPDVELALRDFSKKKQSSSQRIEVPSKHKYVYVLGKTPLETKSLRKLFQSRNKTYPYPKDRGN